MVATLRATQRKNGSTTLEVTLKNCDYQLLWLKIVVNGEMQSNHPDMLQSPTLLVGANFIPKSLFQLTELRAFLIFLNQPFYNPILIVGMVG